MVDEVLLLTVMFVMLAFDKCNKNATVAFRCHCEKQLVTFTSDKESSVI